MRTGNVVVVPAYNEEGGIGQTLDALAAQSLAPDGIVVVDNNSTDDTAGVVEHRQRDIPNLHLVFEEQKGTGTASDTGFMYAIEEIGATTISRTDADASPHADWNEVICNYFASHPKKQLLSGPSAPRRDEFYKPHDEVLWPFRRLWLLGNMSKQYPIIPLRLGRGYNMAVRQEAYEAVDGFPDSSIAEREEDIVLSRHIQTYYGFDALGHSKDMQVDVSMRRLRSLGYASLIPYYWQPTLEKRMKATGGNIDVR